MITIEYTILLAATVAAFTSAGAVLSPTVAAYQGSLHQELLENRATLEALTQVCQPPVSQ